MQKTSENHNLSSAAAHHTVQKSTTLNRRYVKRPEPVAKKIAVLDEKAPRVIESTNLEDAILEAKESVAVSPKITRFPVEAAEEKTEKTALKVEVSTEEEIAEPEVTDMKAAEKVIEVMSEEAEDARAEEAVVEEKTEDKAATKIAVEAETEDLPPAPNPYQAALDALEVRKAAGRAAEFYVGPTAEERKKAEIEKALAEVANATAVAKTLSTRELKLREKAEQKAKAEMARARAREKAETERAALIEKREEAKLAKKSAKSSKKVAKKASQPAKKAAESVLEKNVKNSEMEKTMKKGRGKRVVLALGCSLACMAALGALVVTNIPDISIKVTAMQSGIDAVYPSYVPRDFSLSGVYIDGDGAVVMDFKGPEDAKFSISESESSWDSTALLNNFVKKAWQGEEYTAARENGITIYIYHSSAVWVNGGMLYKITAENGTLTKKQIKNIVTSM